MTEAIQRNDVFPHPQQHEVTTLPLSSIHLAVTHVLCGALVNALTRHRFRRGPCLARGWKIAIQLVPHRQTDSHAPEFLSRMSATLSNTCGVRPLNVRRTRPRLRGGRRFCGQADGRYLRLTIANRRVTTREKILTYSRYICIYFYAFLCVGPTSVDCNSRLLRFPGAQTSVGKPTRYKLSISFRV